MDVSAKDLVVSPTSIPIRHSEFGAVAVGFRKHISLSHARLSNMSLLRCLDLMHTGSRYSQVIRIIGAIGKVELTRVLHFKNTNWLFLLI